MAGRAKSTRRHIIPVLPLRGLTVFPQMELHFDVGRDISVKALEAAMAGDQRIFLVTQTDARDDSPDPDGLYKTGTVSKVKQLVRISADTIRVRIEGLCRAKSLGYVSADPYFKAEIAEEPHIARVRKSVAVEALKRQTYKALEEYAKLSDKLPPESMFHIVSIDDPGQLADVITANISLRAEQKQEILDEFSPVARLEALLGILAKEAEVLAVEREIGIKVRKQIEKTQKEYYLREQMKAIQSELGEKDGLAAEADEYRERIAKLKLPEEVEKKALKEAEKLAKMQPGFAEGSVVRNYLDWILELPWTEKTEEARDIAAAGRILDEDHYGLEKVKERILEYLAIRMYKNSLKGPIICLVGPPGVGKTSVAKSVARALNRKYVRMSLGGVRDEAEIRGHRRTYVGAIPGRVVAALKQAGTRNPLILLDEIDKMSSDFRGDPASAMLEVLDSEQNFAFRDHYIELPYDLSEVLFMTTANNADAIPKPLLDRMEAISISGYTSEEKLRIALDFLVPKQLEAHGASKSDVRFDEAAVRDIISYYTRESGVRELEREIAAVCRKSVKMLVAHEKKRVRVTGASLVKLLGARKYRYDKVGDSNEIGVARGLAWTAVGGETLNVEVNVMKGSGKFELTGQLGSVMKESARAAVSFIRSRIGDLGIDEDFYSKYDIHIHVPEGAIPKDGPSAGITIATAMVSALAARPIRKNVAMTGEITLRGRVLPIGGLKEKVLAAHRAGIDTVIMPEENLKDIENIPGNVQSAIRFVPVSGMDEVLGAALLSPAKPRVLPAYVDGLLPGAIASGSAGKPGRPGGPALPGGGADGGIGIDDAIGIDDIANDLPGAGEPQIKV
ncbi:MAG: endopeptidase La [Clostridiales bacterium]|jgi:ATP-dependent Lon protease|nr:endopeptidase La [Clostridiales bacterium]